MITNKNKQTDKVLASQVYEYSFEFVIYLASDVLVFLIDEKNRLIRIDPNFYSVRINDNLSGGIVTFSNAEFINENIGNTIRIKRIVEYTQSLSLSTATGVPKKALEIALDSIVIQIQQIASILDNISEIKSVGIEWNSTEKYQEGSLVLLDGVFYLSTQDDNEGNSPESGTDWWVKITLSGLSHWESEALYSNGQFVFKDGKLFISKSDDNIGNDPSTDEDNWEGYFISGVYSELVSYDKHQIISHNNNKQYISLQNNNKSNEPVDSPDWWEEYFVSNVWSPGISYPKYEVVSYSNEKQYISIIENNKGNSPDTSPDEWEEYFISNIWSSRISYPLGQVVYYATRHYKSISQNNLNNIPAHETYWELINLHSEETYLKQTFVSKRKFTPDGYSFLMLQGNTVIPADSNNGSDSILIGASNKAVEARSHLSVITKGTLPDCGANTHERVGFEPGKIYYLGRSVDSPGFGTRNELVTRDKILSGRVIKVGLAIDVNTLLLDIEEATHEVIEWIDRRSYKKNDIVSFEGKLYTSLGDYNSGNEPSFSSPYWRNYKSSTRWDQNFTYNLGDLITMDVTRGVFVSKENENLNNYPPDSPESWLKLIHSNVWDSEVEYSLGETTNYNLKLYFSSADQNRNNRPGINSQVWVEIPNAISKDRIQLMIDEAITKNLGSSFPAVVLRNNDQYLLNKDTPIGSTIRFIVSSTADRAAVTQPESTTIVKGTNKTESGINGKLSVQAGQIFDLIHIGDDLEYKKTYDEIQNILDVAPTGEITCIAASNNGRLIAVGHKIAPYISVYSYTGWSFVKKQDLEIPPGHPVTQTSALTAPPTALEFSPDGHLLYVGLAAGSGLRNFVLFTNNPQLVVVKTGEAEPQTKDVFSISISPDGVYEAIGHASGRVEIRNTSTNKILRHDYQGEGSLDVIHALEFSPALSNPIEKYTLAVGHSGRAALLILRWGESESPGGISHRERTGGTITSIAWSHDGELLAVAKGAGKDSSGNIEPDLIRVYDSSNQTLEPIADDIFLRPRGTLFRSVAFSTAKMLAVSLDDNGANGSFSGRVNFYNFNNYRRGYPATIPTVKEESPYIDNITGPIAGALWTGGGGYFIVGTTSPPFLKVYHSLIFTPGVWLLAHVDGPFFIAEYFNNPV